jgi:homeobox protein cut-like
VFDFVWVCFCLQERCAKLERALQAAKSEAAAVSESASAAASDTQALQQQLQQSQQLVKQLETDLLALSSSHNNSTSGSGAKALAAAGGLEGIVAPGGHESGMGSPSASNAAAAAAAAAGTGAGGSPGDGEASAAVLQAVSAQRDRFKARMTELEGEQAQLTTRLQQAAAQVATVTRDNVGLVEKIRYDDVRESDLWSDRLLSGSLR